MVPSSMKILDPVPVPEEHSRNTIYYINKNPATAAAAADDDDDN